MTMIEKVARAIARSIDIDPDDGRAEDAMKWIRITARAAIEAMRDIDDDVLYAGAYDLDMTLLTQWTNMIDAALKED